MKVQLIPLAACCEITMGQAPAGSSYNELGDGYALIAGAGDFGDALPEPKKFTTEASKISKVGDVIMCIRATIGDVNWSDREYCLGRGVAGLRPNPSKLDVNYLWHFISSNKESLASKGTGSTFKQVSRSHIAEWEIPLPSLAEQKRIAAILDKADALRRKRQQAIDLADQFLRSVFLEMFGDPVTNPKGWPVYAVGEITDCIVPGRDKPKSFTGGTPWVTTNDLVHLGTTYEPENFKGLSEAEIAEVRARVVPKDAVLMTCVGDLGVISIAGKDMVINQQLHAFLSLGKTENSFLAYALNFQKGFMLTMASNTTVPYMNKTICNSVPVALPPMELQRKFDEIYRATQKTVATMTAFSTEASGHFNSLSQQAFSGQL